MTRKRDPAKTLLSMTPAALAELRQAIDDFALDLQRGTRCATAMEHDLYEILCAIQNYWTLSRMPGGHELYLGLVKMRDDLKSLLPESPHLEVLVLCFEPGEPDDDPEFRLGGSK